jgi:hypothetical protein
MPGVRSHPLATKRTILCSRQQNLVIGVFYPFLDAVMAMLPSIEYVVTRRSVL